MAQSLREQLVRRRKLIKQKEAASEKRQLQQKDHLARLRYLGIWPVEPNVPPMIQSETVHTESRRRRNVPTALEPEALLIPVTKEALDPYGLGPSAVKRALDSGELTRPKTSRQRTMAYLDELLKWQRENGQTPKLRGKHSHQDEFDRRIAEGKLTHG